jgi:hypothetical protein
VDWEYQKIYLNGHHRRGDDIELLSEAGRAGWELVTVTANSVAYLKRPLEDSVQGHVFCSLQSCRGLTPERLSVPITTLSIRSRVSREHDPAARNGGADVYSARTQRTISSVDRAA